MHRWQPARSPKEPSSAFCYARATADEAISVLEVIRAQPWHRFWPDSLPYERNRLGGVLGHRQVSDAYLVALAEDHAERLVTFDRGLSALHGDAVHLLSPAP